MIAILTAALTLAIAVVALWLASRLRRDAIRTRNWPTAPGKIVERGIEPMQTDARSFTPKLRYSYTVAGEDYIGERVYLTGRMGKMKERARRMVDALPDPIPVRYNPEDPKDAFLLQAPRGIYWIALLFGAGALLWGLMQVLVILSAKF